MAVVHNSFMQPFDGFITVFGAAQDVRHSIGRFCKTSKLYSHCENPYLYSLLDCEISQERLNAWTPQ